MVPIIKELWVVGAMSLPTLAWTLALGTDLGGNATPIGASANVVGTSVAEKEGYVNDLFFGIGHGIGCIGNESWPVVVPGKDWGSLTFEENMVEIAAIVFNRPGLGGLRLEAPTLVKKTGAEVLPKTSFEVDYL